LRGQLCNSLFTGSHILEEGADVLLGVSGADLENAIGDGIDEVAVVGDEQQRTAPRSEVVLEPGDGVDVEVVGWLIEDQHIRVAQQEAGECHPHPPAAGELLDRAFVPVGRKAQSGKDTMRLGLERVAAVGFELRLRLAVLFDHAVHVARPGGFEFPFERSQPLSDLTNVLSPIERLCEHGTIGRFR